jgi:hypothetical protein
MKIKNEIEIKLTHEEGKLLKEVLDAIGRYNIADDFSQECKNIVNEIYINL